MTLIDFNATPRKSFYRGFMKGLGAPFVLFGTFNAPVLPEVMQVKSQAIDPNVAIAGDWMRIGNDFHLAVVEYGKTSKK